jgi:hypothetical protein
VDSQLPALRSRIHELDGPASVRELLQDCRDHPIALFELAEALVRYREIHTGTPVNHRMKETR